MINWIKAYFNLTRGETWGFFVLAIMLILFMISPFILKYFSEPVIEEKDQQVKQALEQFLSAQSSKKARASKDDKAEEFAKAPNYFPFNPNKIGVKEWRELGVPPKLANTIENYKEAGGHFYEKEDLKSIYGMTDTLYKKLIPHVKLPEQNDQQTAQKQKRDVTKKSDSSFDKQQAFEESTKENLNVPLNKADTGQLRQVSGIGDFFAKEIVDLREAFGGFSNKQQLKRVYNLDSSHLKQISPQLTIDRSYIKPLSLKDSSFEAFLRHPYLDYPSVKAIFNYKDRQDTLTPKTINQMPDAQVISMEKYRQIKPYLAP